MLGSVDSAGLGRGLPEIPLGPVELAPGAAHVALIGDRQDDVGVVRTPRAPDAVLVLIRKFLGVTELVAFPEQPAEEKDRAKRVGMVGLQHAFTVVDVFAEDRLGLVLLAEVPEHGSQPLGGVERDRIVGAERAAAVVQITAEHRLGQSAGAGPVEERGQEIVGAKRVAILRAVELGIEADGGPEMFVRPVILAKLEIGPADRLAEFGLDLGLSLEDTQLIAGAVDAARGPSGFYPGSRIPARPGPAAAWSRAR